MSLRSRSRHLASSTTNLRSLHARREPLDALAVGLLTLALALPTPAASQIEVQKASITELQAALADGTVTSAELVDAYLARIAAYDQQGPALNALIMLNPRARAEAEALDRERSRGNVRGPLHGIPIILKDNYDTFDMPTTGASVALATSIPPDDAFQVRKLREAGAVILGKSNLHELAMGITSISGLGGQTRNPYDPTRNPGGSSGGTGAAIAASFAAIGWGSDTCGSIRIPSAHNNLFGLRPTKGLSSIDGIIPLSHTQDVGGPLARSVMDLAIGLDATIGPDPNDAATGILRGLELPQFVASLDANALNGARLGILTASFGDAAEDRETGGIVRAALTRMAEFGATVIDVTVDGFDTLTAGSSVIGFEFKFDLLDYLTATPDAGVRSLGDVLERGLNHAALESSFRRQNRTESRDSDEYRAALAKRVFVQEALRRALEDEDLDALVYPTIRRKAARIGDRQRGSNCQLSASSGFPALSLPAGFTNDGIPVGLEIMGLPLTDARLVALAYAYEQAATPRRAPDFTPALVDARAPVPVERPIASKGNIRLAGRLALDWSTGKLAYDLEVAGVTASDLVGVFLHRGSIDEPGPVVHRLMGPLRTAQSGEVSLGAVDRTAFAASELYLEVLTRGEAAGVVRVPLRDRQP
jgi:Asp-tRNA(Asn)/Glu-tRNA(Gln) amidotransferase A subunit family amidase